MKPSINEHHGKSWLGKVTIAVVGIALLILTLGYGIANTYGQPVSGSQVPPSSNTESKSDPETDELQKKKIQLEVDKLTSEIEKLRTENANNERSLSTLRGWLNLLYGNVSILVAIILGFWGLYRYLRERGEELRKREDERFEQIVTGLGSEHEQQRISAAVLLPTFLRPEYQRFYIQVFNLAAGNLRASQRVEEERPGFPVNAPRTWEDDIGSRKIVLASSTSKAFVQALATVLRDAYPRARNVLPEKPGSDKAPNTGRYLNAAGVILDGTYLAGADLAFAWLREASFTQATLTGAKMWRANLESSNMGRADLRQADLRRANLKGANFKEANLEDADLSNSRIDNTDFGKASLVRVVMEKATASGTNFMDADLTEMKFIEVDFTSSDDNERQANPEDAYRLKGAMFINVSGLTYRQIERCEEKGATFKTGSNGVDKLKSDDY